MVQIGVLWSGDHYTSLVLISVVAPTSCPAHKEWRVLHLELRMKFQPLGAAGAARAGRFCGYQLLARLLQGKSPLPCCCGDGLGRISPEGWEMTAREISGDSVAVPEGAGWVERGIHSRAPGRCPPHLPRRRAREGVKSPGRLMSVPALLGRAGSDI